MDEVLEYVKAQPCSRIQPQKVGANVLDEGVVKAIEEEVQRVNVINRESRDEILRGHLLTVNRFCNSYSL